MNFWSLIELLNYYKKVYISNSNLCWIDGWVGKGVAACKAAIEGINQASI